MNRKTKNKEKIPLKTEGFFIPVGTNQGEYTVKL